MKFGDIFTFDKCANEKEGESWKPENGSLGVCIDSNWDTPWCYVGVSTNALSSGREESYPFHDYEVMIIDNDVELAKQLGVIND